MASRVEVAKADSRAISFLLLTSAGELLSPFKREYSHGSRQKSFTCGTLEKQTKVMPGPISLSPINEFVVAPSYQCEQ
jgi:hypothetical protein